MMWRPFNFFIGVWQGTGWGKPGISRVERKYELVLNEKFIFVQSKSVYEPRQNHPNGEVHEDWGFLSYDRARETFVFRQFHGEGFVNHYLLDQTSEEDQVISFVTEGIENIPPGWQAKESYRILNPDEFVETFQFAAPNRNFETYAENHLHRVRYV